MIMVTGADASIEGKLQAIFAADPTSVGGIEALHVDRLPVGLDGPVPNLIRSGFEEVHGFGGGLCVHIVDAAVSRQWRLTARSLENCVRLRLPFAGSADFDAAAAQVSDEGASCTFLVQPASASLTGVYHAGVAYRYCTLNLSQSFLLQRLGLSWSDLPRPLASAWREQEVALGRFALDRGALAAAGRLFALTSEGAWRGVEVEALALGLLRQVMERWGEARAAGAFAPIRLRPADRRQLQRLRALVEARCPQSVSMTEAVAWSGLNKNKVHAGFQRLYGMSLHDYGQDLRMQRARRLLLETALPVVAVAERAGFSEPTNFTAAFRKHFAVLPSEVRRGRNVRPVAERAA